MNLVICDSDSKRQQGSNVDNGGHVVAKPLVMNQLDPVPSETSADKQGQAKAPVWCQSGVISNDLQDLMKIWPELPEEIRYSILTIAKASK